MSFLDEPSFTQTACYTIPSAVKAPTAEEILQAVKDFEKYRVPPPDQNHCKSCGEVLKIRHAIYWQQQETLSAFTFFWPPFCYVCTGCLEALKSRFSAAK